MSPTWRDAWESAHYGPNGFYRANPNPVDHFRTAVMDSPDTSSKIFDIAYERYQQLGSPSAFTVMDCGAGTDDLLRDLRELCEHHQLPWTLQSLNFTDTDIREITPLGGAGVVIAHELLDDIPMDIAECNDDLQLMTVHVDSNGVETLGEVFESEWVDTWWPATVPGARREIGSTRDAAWAQLLRVFDTGCAIMVDYCTTQVDRMRGVFDAGTLTGYYAGRITRPIPNGTMNITAHVCIESLAQVGQLMNKPTSEITRPDPRTDFHWLVQPL
jgi:SAM-dependent MidA family methyltransferase